MPDEELDKFMQSIVDLASKEECPASVSKKQWRQARRLVRMRDKTLLTLKMAKTHDSFAIQARGATIRLGRKLVAYHSKYGD